MANVKAEWGQRCPRPEGGLWPGNLDAWNLFKTMLDPGLHALAYTHQQLAIQRYGAEHAYRIVRRVELALKKEVTSKTLDWIAKREREKKERDEARRGKNHVQRRGRYR